MLIAVILVAIGLAIYLAVFAQLAIHLRDAGQPALGATVLVGAAASAGLFSVGDALYGVIAQAVVQPGADPGLAKALYQLDQFAGIPMYWLSLLAILSVTLAAARGVFPGWAVWLSGLFAVLVALGGFSVKASGAFAAGHRADRRPRVRGGARVPARGRDAALEREGAGEAQMTA